MLADILKIQKGITSIIGSGGKTTLMYRLAEELSVNNNVVIGTTTQIYKPEHIITLIEPSKEDIISALKNYNCICIGGVNEKGKLVSPEIDFSTVSDLCDYVIVESDGSKGLPMKIHASYEPVIHENTVETIMVLGIKAVGEKMKDVCHRSELSVDTLNCEIDDILTPKMISQILKHEILGDVLVINQVENEADMKNAEYISKNMNIPVFAGEIQKGRLICLHS